MSVDWEGELRFHPCWEFWWAVTGLTIMINLKVTLGNPIGLFLFFIGHELADLVWYAPISIFVYLGGKSFNPKVYKYILIVSGGFMITFGIYLVLNIMFFPPIL